MPKAVTCFLLLLLTLACAQQVGFSPSTNSSFPLSAQVKEAPSVYPHSALNQMWRGASLQLIAHPLFTLAAMICLAVSLSLLTAGKHYSACKGKQQDPDVKVLMQAGKAQPVAKTRTPLIRRYDKARLMEQAY